MDNMQKVDFNTLFFKFVELYGDNALLYFIFFVSFMFFIWMTYLYIRHRGWITTPLERSLKKQESNLEKNTELLGRLGEMINHILISQKSNLQEDQIKVIVNDKIILYKKYFLAEILDIYIKNHISAKQRTLKKMKDNFETIIRNEDDSFFKLPGAAEHIVPSTVKIKTLEIENIYEKIYTIMIEENDEKEVARKTKGLLDSFISLNWKI